MGACNSFKCRCFSVSTYEDSLIWFGLYDIGDPNKLAVRFRITPSDNDPKFVDETLPMFVNNSTIPPGANVSVDKDGEEVIRLEMNSFS